MGKKKKKNTIYLQKKHLIKKTFPILILKSTFATYKFILMFKKIHFLFIVVGITYTIQAQEFLNGSDLSQIKAEQFNAEQIAQMGAELKANNMTMEQAEPLAIAKGMSAVEFNKLKARLESSNAVSEEVKKDIDPQAANAPEKLAEKNVSVFGSELFTTKSLSFEPNQNLPTPNNYILIQHIQAHAHVCAEHRVEARAKST